MKNYIEKIKNFSGKLIKKNKYIIMLLIATLLLSIAIFGNKNYYEGDDSKYHIANISAYAKQISFRTGNIFPSKIIPKVAHNYGYGVGIFYPQLPHLTAAYIYKIIHVFGLSIYWAIKITHFIVLFLSSVTMYYLAHKLINEKKIAVIASIILLLTPFRLAEVVVRDAFAECFTYIFIPMILLGIFELCDKKYYKFLFTFVIGYIGMLWSHQVLTLYITLLTIPIYLFNIKKIINKKSILYIIIACLLIGIITLPSILPMIYHKVNGSYVVFDGDAMGGYKKISKHSLSLSDLVVPTNHNEAIKNTIGTRIDFNINIIVLLLCGITIYNFKKINLNKEQKKQIKILGLVTLLALWMSTYLFPWKHMPDIMYMLQFPWRLLTLTSITISILAAISLKIIEKNERFNIICIAVVGLILASGVNTIGWHYYNRKLDNKSEFDYEDYRCMGYQREYLPVNTKKNLDYFDNRNSDIIVKTGNAELSIYNDDTPRLEFCVTNVTENTEIELPRLFYFGYTLKNINTGEVIETKENEKGFISATIKNEGQYVLDYTGINFIRIYNVVLAFVIPLIIVIIIVITTWKIIINYKKKGMN